MTKKQIKFIKLVKSLITLDKTDIITVDKKAREISICTKSEHIRFFYNREIGKFIILKVSDTVCEIEDLEFSDKISLKLRKLIDSFIKMKTNNTNGNKPYRVIRKRSKDKNT